MSQRRYDIGVQSVVFQERSLDDLLDAVDGIGLEHLELWDAHLSPKDDDPAIEAGIRRLDATDVSVCGFGVIELEDVGEAREYFDFADRLDADYVTVNYPPTRDDITEDLLACANEFDLNVAIHNYSTVHHDDLSRVFSSIDDVRSVLDRYEHPRLGVCVDTGHFLVMDDTPNEVIPALGDRIEAVHLKDTSEAEIEDLPGAGELDLPSVLTLLDEHADLDAPVVIEYELPDDDVLGALDDAAANVREALRT